MEAAQLGRRYRERFGRYYDRKEARTNPIVVSKTLSNKRARIYYDII